MERIQAPALRGFCFKTFPREEKETTTPKTTPALALRWEEVVEYFTPPEHETPSALGDRILSLCCMLSTFHLQK